MENAVPSVRLSLSDRQMVQGFHYQLLTVELTRPDRIVDPEDLATLELPAGIDTTGGVVISGRAPIWLYSYLVHELHPTAWVACYDPRLGAVVVATHSRLARIGQVIPIAPLQRQGGKPTLCPAILVVGAPDSGKSVLSHALFQALLPDYPEIYLQRAQWDGEGNYILEAVGLDEAEQEAFKAQNRGSLTDRFFPYQAQAILQLRRQKQLVLVDVGGKVQPEKQPILEACSHYLIISRPEAIDSWHEFCRDRGNLKPLAVVRSTLEECEMIHQQQPYLEMTCGAWKRGQGKPVPTVLLDRVRELLR